MRLPERPVKYHKMSPRAEDEILGLMPLRFAQTEVMGHGVFFRLKGRLEASVGLNGCWVTRLDLVGRPSVRARYEDVLVEMIKDRLKK